MANEQALSARIGELGREPLAVLDAMPAPVALIDSLGRIAAVNRLWRQGDPAVCLAQGASYLGVLDRDDGAHESIADPATVLREILSGERDLATFAFPAGQESRHWYQAHLQALPVDGQTWAIVVYLDVTPCVMAQRHLVELAHFDSLTGLPNRMLFLDRLHHAVDRGRRHGTMLAMVMADIDQFKTINDTLGHVAGDQLLKQFGERLRATVRQSDTVGRLGGDEFALIIPDLATADDAGGVARKVLASLKTPFEIDGRSLFCSASLGVAIYPDDAADADVLFTHADAAMYRAKQLGCDNIQFFTSAMNDRALARLKLDAELRQALASGQFEVYYQPRVSCLSGKIVGAEALLRWNHPLRGLVFPGEFIPVLEEINLIDEVGHWVLDQTCRQMRQWLEEGLDLPMVAVNLSPRQLMDGALPGAVAALLKKYDLAGDRLELELTESLLLQDVEKVLSILDDIHRMGIRLAVDDFGTGHTSLSYLKQFPLDSIKVDRAFVEDITADPDDASITRAVITMAHQLKLKVVAEGVETEGQLALLAASQCDEIQGYFFSRPVPAEAMAGMLREKRVLAPELIHPEDRQRTILLVDDEDNILSSLRRLLRRDGYRILAASSAAEGLELLAENEVDVIVSDQRMPAMTGVEFLRRVKMIHPDTVRMVLSGYTELQSITDAINEGAIYKFLTKPWDDEQLRANIEEAFRHKELADENRRLSNQLQVANRELEQTNRHLEELLDRKQRRIVRDETMLGVVQEVLHQVPIPIVGIDNEGMIVLANEEADAELGKGYSMLGMDAAACLPPPLFVLLNQPGSESIRWAGPGGTYRACCRPMDDHRHARGKLLMLVPESLADASL